MTSQAYNAAREVDIYAGVPFSNRNYIVDGNFDSWINSSTVLGVAGFNNNSATMYYNYAGQAGNATITRTSWPMGTEPVGMTSPTVNYLSHQQTVTSTGTVANGLAPYMNGRVESVRTLSGRSATFSCWLWVASGTQTITNVLMRQGFGTGGSPSGTVIIDPTVNWVVTTTPQRFSVRVDFPSVAGKTFGTDGKDCLYIGIWFPTTSGYTINTSQWQLEACSANAPAVGLPTAFEYRGAQAEIARIQRYFQSGATGWEFPGPATGTYSCAQWVTLPVIMRGAPNIVMGTPSENSVAGTISVGPVNAGSFRYFSNNAGSGTTLYTNSYTADARL